MNKAINPIQNVLYPLLLGLIALAVYSRVFFYDFIEAYDDEIYVTMNPNVSHGLNAHVFRWSFTTFAGGNWTPLTWWSHALDVQLFGMNPAGHHATNLAFHIINALLVFYLFRRLTSDTAKSFMVAALFALHPLHVESVAWVAERKDVLSAFLGLCALHAYVSFRASRSLFHYGALFLLLCLSLMAKPMLVTLPVLLLMLDVWPYGIINEQSWRALIREKLPLMLPVTAVSVVTILAQGSVGALASAHGTPLPVRIGAALDGYMYYLRSLFFPHNLAFFYPYSVLPFYRVCIDAVILALITWLSWKLRHRFPWLLTGWLWFLVMLIPVIGIVAVGSQAYADRYTYLPSLGIFTIMVWGTGALVEGRKLPEKVVAAVALLVIIACVCTTWKETGYWKNGFTLYQRAIAVNGSNWLAYNNLGVMLNKHERFQEAIGELEQAVFFAPNVSFVHYNLAVAYNRTGDTRSARLHYQEAIRIDPAADDNYYASLARTMWADTDLPVALGVLRAGLQRFPSSSLLKGDEAYVLMKMGQFGDAINAFRVALQLEPGYMQLYPLLAETLISYGKPEEAREIYLQLQVRNPRAAQQLVPIIQRPR
ncbi:MAG: tetratricopeptide repeat protein [Geobacteraceae bacterium]|nr:tetratricopeptide repeat protein [Geobacteraceae bacterium]